MFRILDTSNADLSALVKKEDSSLSHKKKKVRENVVLHDFHHVYPKSRFPELASTPWNKVQVYRCDHVKYHGLFGTKTPEESAVYMARYFWGGNTDIIEKVMRELQKLL